MRRLRPNLSRSSVMACLTSSESSESVSSPIVAEASGLNSCTPLGDLASACVVGVGARVAHGSHHHDGARHAHHHKCRR